MIIDISKYQGKIDWEKVKMNPEVIKGVFIKASEGIGYCDPNLKDNALGAFKMGFKLGYYHFASLNDHNVVNDAEKEAYYFLSIIKGLPINTLPLVLDIEENKNQLTPLEVLTWIKAFFSTLEKAGFKDYVLYSYSPFLDKNLPINHDLNNIRLWIAAYTNILKLPKSWNTYWLWQYTQKGKVNGIIGNVDLNKI